jgi:ubiquinone/menaquinone biosynthesis C-methylase UbiE
VILARSGEQTLRSIAKATKGDPKLVIVHFARARVESLPFNDDCFDATICCGSLHLFTDTVTALREMARVMKPGAILAVFTFTAGRIGILKYRWVREWSRRKHGLHVFSLSEMEQYLATSGFEDIQPQVTGSVLTFSARKRGKMIKSL